MPRSKSFAVRLKRVYDPPARGDGSRVLLDRVWPRGIAKTALELDAWPRELAPSTALRQWFHRDADRFTEFRKRYLAELAKNGEALKELKDDLRGSSVTLLTAAKDPEHSHLAVFRDALLGER